MNTFKLKYYQFYYVFQVSLKTIFFFHKFKAIKTAFIIGKLRKLFQPCLFLANFYPKHLLFQSKDLFEGQIRDKIDKSLFCIIFGVINDFGSSFGGLAVCILIKTNLFLNSMAIIEEMNQIFLILKFQCYVLLQYSHYYFSGQSVLKENWKLNQGLKNDISISRSQNYA